MVTDQYASDKAVLKRDIGGLNLRVSQLEERRTNDPGRPSIDDGRAGEDRIYQRAKAMVERSVPRLGGPSTR